MTGRGKGEETGRAERVTRTWPHVGPDALEQARQARQAAHQPGQPGPGNFINIKLMSSPHVASACAVAERGPEYDPDVHRLGRGGVLGRGGYLKRGGIQTHASITMSITKGKQHVCSQFLPTKTKKRKEKRTVLVPHCNSRNEENETSPSLPPVNYTATRSTMDSCSSATSSMASTWSLPPKSGTYSF